MFFVKRQRIHKEPATYRYNITRVIIQIERMEATKAVLQRNENGECNVPKGRKFCFYTSHMRAFSIRFISQQPCKALCRNYAFFTCLPLIISILSSLCTTRGARYLVRIKNFSTISSRDVSSPSQELSQERLKHSRPNNILRPDRLGNGRC